MAVAGTSDVSIQDRERPRRANPWLARAAIALLGASIAATAAIGALGPSAAVPAFRSAAPWPPWFTAANPSPTLVAVILWAAVVFGGAGLAAGLVAARRGWRPRPGRLIAGSAIAVLALMVIPPLGSTDIMDYAVYGRIAALGHSPYQMTPLQLESTGDPVGAAAPTPWDTDPSVYGPLATAAEWAAADVAGGSAARTVFWLKVENGLAYLALVLGLDRLARSDAARRIRVHLLWSVNPLMLLAVMAGGHVDGLSAAIAFFAVASLCPGGVWRPGPRRWLLAGLLLGAATAVKAPLLLVAAGLGWVARRSRRTLAVLGIGMLAVLVPCYLVAGWPAIAAVAGRAAGSPAVYEPWQLLARGLGVSLGDASIDLLGALGAVILAVIMLRRMPAAPASYPFARPALALMLAWLIATPQQRPWYDAAIFPLLALMPATRLDWIAVARAAAAALAELPGVTYYPYLLPGWLSATAKAISTGLAPIVLAGAALTLLWLCVSGRWKAADDTEPSVFDAAGSAPLKSA
jgi:hypothetical protein